MRGIGWRASELQHPAIFILATIFGLWNAKSVLRCVPADTSSAEGLGSTWMPRKKRSTFSASRFSREQCRALKKLAGNPRGLTEQLLLAHGFSAEMLRGLVRAQFAIVVTEPTMQRPGVTIIVERIRITDAGRRALEQ